MRSHAKASTRSGASKAKRLVLPAAVLALVLAFAAPQASALKFHAFKEVFGSAAQPSFEARAIAIDQSTGDVLVMDKTDETSTVKRFNADGTPDNFSALGTNVIDGQGGPDTTPQNGLEFGGVSESQIAVDNSGTTTDGNIYVTQGFPNLINVFSSTGAYLGQLTAAGATDFSESCGVAVDSAGAVYVGDSSAGIHKFVPAANPPLNADHTSTFTTTTQPCTLAAGAGATAGFLFPAQYEGPVSKIDSATGELKYTVAPGFHTTVTVNPANGHVYAASGSVEEFDASGAVSATAVTTTTVEGSSKGLAVRGSSGDIYYGVSDKIQVLSGAVSTSPDVTTTAATGVTDTAATLNGTVNPDGEATSECLFEWGLTTAYGNTVPCVPNPAGIGSGSSPVAVSAAISGLDVGTVYHYRLKAANPNGPVFGQDETLQSAGPRLLDSWAEDVLLTEATLKAEIDPEGGATTYRFEYGTSAAYGSETEELAVGSDSSVHTVIRFLEGLTPGTEYHYRVVATSAAGENVGPDREIRTFRPFSADTDCPNQANRYGAGASLPDCRAYELVSPLDKNGGDIEVLRSADSNWPARGTKSTPSGDKLTYSAYRAFAGALSVPWSSQYIAQRLPDSGWQTHAINPPQIKPLVFGAEAINMQYQAFTDDLCHGWLINHGEPPLSPAGLAGIQNVYRRNDRLCGPEGFEAVAPVTAPPGPPGLNFQGASADGSHAIFSAGKKLASEGTEGVFQLYESVAPEALPRFVCILPNEEPWNGPCGAGSGENNVSYGPTRPSLTGAISEDGERIFWTTEPGFYSLAEGSLYVRIGGSETVPVSQVGEEEAGTSGSWFQGAAQDGSRAVYTTDQGGGGPNNHVLFAFDVDTEATEHIANGVYGVAGISEDARQVYFVSKETLPGSGQNSEGDEAVPNQPNLYLYDADGGGTFAFIGTLASQDAGLQDGPIAREPKERTSRVTPDGRYVAFTSFASLTGYDNEGGSSGFLNPLAYVYDAAKDELVCASCIPSGARGEGEPFREVVGQVIIRQLENAMFPLRLLVDGRLFFQSVNALTPRDSNGKIDVYQWEQEGVGGCAATDSTYAPGADGCISLISSGTSAFDSEFAEASANGDDVFFYTTSSLAAQDYGLRDIYDARVGGGFPLPPEAPECVGDACQGIPPAPNDPTPASAGFRGAGDPAPRKAQRRRCRARNRQGAKNSKAKQKKAKRCRRNNRRAGR